MTHKAVIKPSVVDGRLLLTTVSASGAESVVDMDPRDGLTLADQITIAIHKAATQTRSTTP